MAIAYITNSVANPGTSSSATKVTSAVDTTGADAIIVFTQLVDSLDKMSSVTDSDGNTYTLITSMDAGQSWHYAHIATGITTSASNVVTVTSTTSERGMAHMVAYSGVDQVTPTYAAATDIVSPMSIDITTTSDTDLCVSYIGGRALTITGPSGSQTERVNTNGSFCDGAVMDIEVVTAGTQTMGWTSSGTTYIGSIAFGVTAAILFQTEIEGYRFREDDGSETTATWLEAQDTVASVEKETAVRLRMLSDFTVGPSDVKVTLQYKRTDEDSTQWRNV
tara:strand:- start:76029 stop:76862 length:834 start_codon:yes stop_codon:yes gene_type:complete